MGPYRGMGEVGAGVGTIAAKPRWPTALFGTLGNVLLWISVFFVSARALPGCTPQQAQTLQTIERDALAVADAACVYENADATDETILEICGIEQQLAPVVKKFLASARIERAKNVNAARKDAIASGKCAP